MWRLWFWGLEDLRGATSPGMWGKYILTRFCLRYRCTTCDYRHMRDELVTGRSVERPQEKTVLIPWGGWLGERKGSIAEFDTCEALH
jgi:hypothetical protein